MIPGTGMNKNSTDITTHTAATDCHGASGFVRLAVNLKAIRVVSVSCLGRSKFSQELLVRILEAPLKPMKDFV